MAAPTRLWIGTFTVEMPESMDLTRVKAQRVLVAPLDWKYEDVREALKNHTSQRYADNEVSVVIETLHPVQDLADLAERLLTYNVASDIISPGIPEEARPVELHVEMAYEEVDGNQQTPSRLESVVFPCRLLAEKAQELIGTTFADDWRINCWPDGCTSMHSDNPQDAVDLARSMLDEHDGDDEEDDDGQTQEVSEENP